MINFVTSEQKMYSDSSNIWNLISGGLFNMGELPQRRNKRKLPYKLSEKTETDAKEPAEKANSLDIFQETVVLKRKGRQISSKTEEQISPKSEDTSKKEEKRQGESSSFDTNIMEEQISENNPGKAKKPFDTADINEKEFDPNKTYASSIIRQVESKPDKTVEISQPSDKSQNIKELVIKKQDNSDEQVYNISENRSGASGDNQRKEYTEINNSQYFKESEDISDTYEKKMYTGKVCEESTNNAPGSSCQNETLLRKQMIAFTVIIIILAAVVAAIVSVSLRNDLPATGNIRDAGKDSSDVLIEQDFYGEKQSGMVTCPVCKVGFPRARSEYRHQIKAEDILFFDTEKCYRRFLQDPDMFIDRDRDVDVRVKIRIEDKSAPVPDSPDMLIEDIPINIKTLVPEREEDILIENIPPAPEKIHEAPGNDNGEPPAPINIDRKVLDVEIESIPLPGQKDEKTY
jgi:YHS domain-containing protein